MIYYYADSEDKKAEDEMAISFIRETITYYMNNHTKKYLFADVQRVAYAVNLLEQIKKAMSEKVTVTGTKCEDISLSDINRSCS